MLFSTCCEYALRWTLELNLKLIKFLWHLTLTFDPKSYFRTLDKKIA